MGTDVHEAPAAVTDAPATEAAPPPAYVIPDWLRDADQEERAELVALGVLAEDESPARYDDPSITDAVVSRALRARHLHEADIERFDAAAQKEVEYIRFRYDRLKGPAVRQAKRLGEWLLTVASAMAFTGKKKSRSVGWGTVGRRMSRERVDIIDEKLAISHLQTAYPQAVDATISLPYSLYLALQSHLDVTTDLGKELMGWLVKNGPKLSLSKTDAGDALHALKVTEIPGAKLMQAEDRPFFEVEAPPDFITDGVR